MSRQGEALRTTIGLGLSLAALTAACSDSNETSRVDVTLEYPNDGARDSTGSVHLWVLRASDAEDAPGCAALIASENEPYDADFERAADEIFLQPDEPDPVAEGVPRDDLLVYVEGVDFVGRTHLAGCTPVTVSGSSISVTVALRGPGTYDCGEGATEDGAPCDDGMLCTVQESCDSGSCEGGIARDCTGLANDCNAAACEEGVGCVREPLDGASCEDGLFCFTGDTCADGMCVGIPRDCSTAVSPTNGCQVGVCNEGSNFCQVVNVPNTIPATPCDLFCRIGGTCSSGTCIGGSTRNCTAEVGDQCNTGTCDETNDECDKVPLTGPVCNDNNICTSSTTCQAGTCGGGVVADVDNDGYSPVGCPPETIGSGDCDDTVTAVNPAATEGPLGNPTCSDAFDNDCDGLINAADPGCQ